MTDIIDSRELAEELEELRETARDFPDEMTEEEQARMEALTELEDEISEWHDGATLIAEHAFEDYARELAEDIGAIDRNLSWPLYCIDWKHAARELAMDYTTVEFDGTTYYVRP